MTNYLRAIVVALAFLASSKAAHGEEPEGPFLQVLGVAQDAGYPQAGCYQAHCMPGWQDARLQRGAVSLGLVDPVGGSKYLFEATPDLPRQLFHLNRIAPDDQYKLSGIFVTHAHIGHYAGLMHLGHEAMGAQQIPVFAMPRMYRFLAANGPWSQLVDFRNIVLQPLQADRPVALGDLKVTPFPVPHRDEYSETVGYRIDGPARSAVFIPDINKWQSWSKDLKEVIRGVDYALLDATFFADGELPGRDMSKVPHPFVEETMKLLESLPDSERNKVWFIHFNHSNPLLDLASEQSERVRSAGFNIAVEGLRLDL